MKSIQEIYSSKTGKVSDKWESYLPHYNEIFKPLQKKNVSILEIGVQNGGSLEVYAEYFASGESFIGCDIDQKCSDLDYDDDRIKVVVGNVNKETTYKKITEVTKIFDIIIDDGSHLSGDIINSFLVYFPHVRPGGVYIVEDIHTLYLRDWEGGILNEAGAMSFFKKIIDITNYQFWKDDLSIATFLRTFFDNKYNPETITKGWIESIEFKNSIITIKKSMVPSHDKLGKRITAGHDAMVTPLPNKNNLVK
jgi:hypothetical protein